MTAFSVILWFLSHLKFKSLKMCVKSDFKEIILKLANLQHMGKEKRPFYYHKFFVPNGLSAPALGYIHVKIRLQRIFFLNWQQMGKVIRNLC